MALLHKLFGRRTAPNPDPEPGEGGYEYPRGPMGQTGYPGSTSQVRADPPETGAGLHDDYGGRGTGYGDAGNPDARRHAALVPGSYEPAPAPPPRTPRGIDRAWVPLEPQQDALQGDAAEWYGGQYLRCQPGAGNIGLNPPAVRHTETPGHRNRPVISRGTPGGATQRNTRFYAGRKAAPDGDNRYVFGGPNGGAETYSFDAQMPYTGHGAHVPEVTTGRGVPARFSVRGAVLSGDRLYYEVAERYFDSQGGQVGIARERGWQHRPTEFYEPGPWTATFYDTTQSAGGPGEAGTGGQAPDMIYYSPRVAGRRRA